MTTTGLHKRRTTPLKTIVRVISPFPLWLFVGCSSTTPLVTQWEYTGGPYAQNISAVVIDAKQPATFYAGLTNGDLYRTSDGGQQWVRAATIQSRTTIHQLLQDPENAERMFAATSAGTFVSTNRGKEWQDLRVIPGGSGDFGCRVLAVDPWKPVVIYAGTKGQGIFKSTDGGRTWNQISGGPDARLGVADVYDIKIDVTRPDVVYAAISEMGLVRSSDAGITWTRLTEEYSGTSSVITHLLLHPRASGTIIFGTNAGSIIKSTNGGQSWSPTRRGEEADRILSLMPDPDNPDVVFAGTEGGMLRSTDFGDSWTPAGGTLSLRPACIALPNAQKNRSILAFGGGVGLQVSSDGGQTWRHADKKLGGARVTLLKTNRAGDLLFAAAGNTLLRWSADSNSWTPASTGLKGGDVAAVAFDEQNSSILYAATPAGVFKSTDTGNKWMPVSRTLWASPIFLDIHPSIPNRMFASGEQGLFVSTNRGNTWTKPRPVAAAYLVKAMTFTPTNAGVIFAATVSSGMIKTTNGGFTWETARRGLPDLTLRGITLDDENPSLCLAWTSQGDCYRSTNQGLEWDQYATPWGPSDSVVVAIDRYQPSSVVAVLGGREVYYSNSGGGTWVPILEKGLRLDVFSAHWNAATGTLFVGTRDKGVYRLSLGPLLKERCESQSGDDEP